MKWFIFLLVVHIVATSPTPEVIVSITDRKILRNIPNHMNEEHSACGNYFEYACGKYAERHIYDSYSNILQMLNNRVLEDLRELMEELRVSSRMAGFDESSLDAKVLRYYQTCKNAPSETRSLEHFLELASPGEDFTWPLLTPAGTKWPKDQFKWMDTLAYFQRLGLTNVLINVNVEQNSELSADPVLKLSAPSFKDYYKMDSLKVLNEMRFEFRRSPPLNKLYILENRIESIGRQQPNEPTVYYMSVEQIEARIGLNFRKFIEAIVGHPISPQYRVLVQNLEYFVALKRQMESADAEVLATYLMARFVIYIEENSLTGRDRNKCLIDLIGSMNLAWNLLYKERFQNPKTLRLNIQEVEHIFEQLRRQLLNKINQNRLGLSEQQKRVAIEKVKDVVLNIGNVPKDLDHRSFATRYFENLEISSVDLDYGRVQLKILEIHIRKKMDQLLLPESSSEKNWYLPIPIKNVQGPTSAYYVFNRNFIVIPYAFLQEPFFMYDSHDVFKYSLMGFALAHEMMHAIGRRIVTDIHGNYQEIGKEILYSSKFQNGLDCMNRPKTDFIEERMADIEGVRLAFSTYSSQNTRNRNDKHLGAVSREQIFFLNLAQFFCSKRSSGQLLDHDAHPLRLLQIVNNNDNFDKAFGCQRKSESCQIW